MTPFSFETFCYLAPFIFLAGTVDSIAGGGGLISLPAYLAVGMNPLNALGTNQLSSGVGTIASAINYFRRIRLHTNVLLPAMVTALIGSALGARTVVLLDPHFVLWFLVFAIPAVAFLLWKSKGFGEADQSDELAYRNVMARAISYTFALSFYDGFFGPGSGTFLVLGYVQLLRFHLVKAIAYARCLNLATNVAAIVAFVHTGFINVPLGLALGALGFIGNYVGSHIAIKRGVRIIRPLIFIVMSGLIIKVIFELI